MAHVNGNRYHSFGQGARRENEKAATDSSRDKGGDGGQAESSQYQTHIKEDGGEYHVKHEGEKPQKFGSKEEMMNHLDEHYHGGEEHESDEEMGDEEGGSLSGAVKSLLE